MNQVSTEPTGEISWIPLKDAARILGCSVKTIRRRIKGGTWRSMIEYQGQKAIRLVAREDVLRDSAHLERIPGDSPEAALALQALDGLPLQLGEVLKSYLSRLKAETDRAGRIWRVYLILAVSGAAVFFGGLGYYLNSRQERALEGQIVEVSRTLSTTFSRGQAGLEGELSLISTRAAETRRLAEEAGRRGERQGRDLESLLESVRILEEVSRGAREEAAAAREELATLRREVSRLREGRPREEAVLNEPATVLPAGGEEPAGDNPAPEEEPPEEEKKSRFLGIF